MALATVLPEFWDAVKSRSAGSSCVAGVALDVVKSRSAGSSCVAGVVLCQFTKALDVIASSSCLCNHGSALGDPFAIG